MIEILSIMPTGLVIYRDETGAQHVGKVVEIHPGRKTILRFWKALTHTTATAARK